MLCPKCLKAELIELNDEEGALRCPNCGAVLYLAGEPVYPESEEEYILWQ
jgi:uncharacterized Zn finger protein